MRTTNFGNIRPKKAEYLSQTRAALFLSPKRVLRLSAGRRSCPGEPAGPAVRWVPLSDGVGARSLVSSWALPGPERGESLGLTKANHRVVGRLVFVARGKEVGGDVKMPHEIVSARAAVTVALTWPAALSSRPHFLRRLSGGRGAVCELEDRPR